MNYKGKIKFKATHDWDSQNNCTIEIDFDSPDVMEKIKAMVEFWTGWETLLAESADDYVKAFVKQCGAWVGSESPHYPVLWIRDSFGKKEGWVELDGTHGITLLQRNATTWDAEEYDIEILK